ncbi:hypothetical protein [Lacticaseibacillus pantheris]|uniref:hypothetical protein n=1 Tax=Lacticaseibacillus pantheris TaxID=171523 RepID=UPI0026587901|nr:hypothetical protein [Lacticaseibacillus pantheris]WKF86111.1 hypothetical protein QY874_05960 [Lacticaseibacillus pantheris]
MWQRLLEGTFGEAQALLHLYLICLIIHLLLLLLDRSGVKLRELLPQFIFSEFVNVLLIIMCNVLDRVVPYLHVEWDWSISLLFTLLVILEEMLWIISRASNYINTGFLKDVVLGISEIVKQRINK